MQTSYFRINNKEYCHITDDCIFIINSKNVTRVPEPFELSETWGIISILNYLLFAFLLIYASVSFSYYGIYFLKQPVNYGALFLLFISFIRIKNGILSSKTPTIFRNNIKSVHFKTPFFSYPRLEVYFTGAEGKTLRKTIPVLYKNEALPMLREAGVLKN